MGGGAICVRSQPGTQVQVTGSLFFGNQAVDTTNGLGGAIYVEYGTAAVLDSAFIFNSAHFGGAVYAALDNATVTLEGSATSTPFASKLQLNANTATEDGGALYNKGGVMTINNAVVTVNRTPTQTLLAGYGGAIYSEGVLTLTNSIVSKNVSGNTANSNQGGGVLNTGRVELYSMTIVTNTNGVWSSGVGNTRFRDTVLQNPDSLNCDGDGTAQISDDSHNFSTDNSCPLPNSQTGLGLDPKLGPLTVDALGPTFYHMPLAGSPLINAGFNCPEHDQRGAVRPDACDIGAVEYGGLLPRVYVPLIFK